MREKEREKVDVLVKKPALVFSYIYSAAHQEGEKGELVRLKVGLRCFTVMVA